MEYEIKKFTSIKDAERAFEIVDRALQEDFPYKPETIAAYRKKVFNGKYFRDFFKDATNISFGAYKDEKLIGFIALKKEYGGVVYVDWIVVEKQYRGKGLGGALLRKAEKWALGNGFHCIYLFTETEENKKFYEKKGYRYVGTHYGFWFGEDEHIFSKNIK